MSDSIGTNKTCDQYVAELVTLISDLSHDFPNGGKYDAGKTASLVERVVETAGAENVQDVNKLRAIVGVIKQLRKHDYFADNSIDTDEVRVSGLLDTAIDSMGEKIATAMGSNQYPALPGTKGFPHAR